MTAIRIGLRGAALLGGVVLLSACATGDAGMSKTAKNLEQDAEVLDVKADSLEGERTRLTAQPKETERTLERLYEGKGFAW